MRSDDFPEGLPDLSQTDKAKVRIGNRLARISASLALCAVHHRIPGTLENPATSRIWNLKCMKHLFNQKPVDDTTLDFCMYGTPWRKGTKLVYWSCRADALRRVCSSRQGICDCSGRPHQIIQGIHPTKKVFWSSIAEPYPTPLCRAWAKMFQNARAVIEIGNLRGAGR